MASIYLYAELLLNIRQMTVIGILPSDCNESTRIALGKDRKTLRLQHSQEEATVELPSIVSNEASLRVPGNPTQVLSFRLPIGTIAKTQKLVESIKDAQSPWIASGLCSKTRINCSSCNNMLIEPGDVRFWKDLPSGGWADMMDFWHCHKPSVQNGEQPSAGLDRGYSASNVMGPVLGTGLVDTSHLWFASGQCKGIEVCDLSLSLSIL